MHAGQLATLVPQLVYCCPYVKHRPVPLLHLDVLPDSLPPGPVDEQDENVSVVTDDSNRLSTPAYNYRA